MQKTKKILIFTTAYRPMIGGSERALEEIICRLPEMFFDIITPRYDRKFKKSEPGANFHIYRIGLGLRAIDKIVFPISGFLKALKLKEANTYHAVHAYQASYGGGAAWLIKSFFSQLPFVLTIQEGKKMSAQGVFINFFRRLIIKKADIITAISNYLADYAKKVNPKAEFFLIPNGVDLKKFKGESLKLKAKNPNEKIIITVSRLVEKNGVGDLIDAFHILNYKFKIPARGTGRRDSKLLIVGDGPLMKSLKFKVKSLKLENKVKFTGEKSGEEVLEYLAQADVFARPSLSEGLGTAFLEAMAVSVPIIGTRTGGILDFLKPLDTNLQMNANDANMQISNENGVFAKVSDPKDLAEKIAFLLQNPEIAQRLGQNGRKLVEENYTWSKIASEFGKLYNSLV